MVRFWFCCLLLALTATGWTQTRPNIVVFIGDDVGMELGCYGDAGAHTPNMDRLAAGGLLCRKAFLTSPQCSPSRTSILSGQFAHTIGTEDLHTGINDTTFLLPHYLQQAGYYTGIMLKTHLGEAGLAQFSWNESRISATERREKGPASIFSTFLDQAGNRPFFMWVGFHDAHRPYDHSSEKLPVANDPAAVQVPPYLVDAPGTRRDLADYYDEVSRMDVQIGEMVAVLEARQLLNNTLIVVLSDNGKPFPRAKGTLYDSGLQTPLIFHWPAAVQAGLEYPHLVSAIDLMPTLLDVAGVQAPGHLYGQSIRPVFSNTSLPGRKYVFAERNWHDADEYMRSIRTDSFLLVYNAYHALPHGTPRDLSTSPSWFDLKTGQAAGTLSTAQAWVLQAPRHMIELYDVKTDPHQLRNVSGQAGYLSINNQLTNELVEWMKTTKDHPPHLRRRHDTVDRLSGFPLAGDRAFFGLWWDE